MSRNWEERTKTAQLSCCEESINKIYKSESAYRTWMPQEVDDQILQDVYDLARWSPSAMNQFPLRVTYIKSAGAKEKLLPCIMERNVEEVSKAPVVVILSYDLQFWVRVSKLKGPEYAARFQKDPDRAERDASFNASILAGFYLAAARLKGLAIYPVEGWLKDMVDSEFHSPNPSTLYWKSFMLCTMGISAPSEQGTSSPLMRLRFDQANIVYDCRIDEKREEDDEQKEGGAHLNKPNSSELKANEAKLDGSEDSVPKMTLIDQEKVLFREARSYAFYQPNAREVMKSFGVEQLKKIYDIAKLCPSLFNSAPLRVAYVFAPRLSEMKKYDDEDEDAYSKDSSTAQKAYTIVMNSLSGGNVESTRTAPLIAVIAADFDFVSKLESAKDLGDLNAAKISEIAINNALYGFAWLVIAIRAMGFDCGTMGGFDKEKAAELFMPENDSIHSTEENSQGDKSWRVHVTRGWKPLLLLKIGPGDESKLNARGDRPSFEEACSSFL